ncbi:hypothetical protein BGW80DRAFT_1448479 [Lactifluus volemus]|nr:hypothetical protein BGW80DRAFT_1448479 [Lactifluus volemus]
MTSNSFAILPYKAQPLISNILNIYGQEKGQDTSDVPLSIEVKCVQGLGSEIYVGCSNGDLLHFALKSNVSEEVNISHHSETTQPASYTLLSRQTLPTGKSIDEIVLVPSISRALVLSDRQIFIHIIPSLELVPGIKPIRNVMAFAVDHQHILRTAQAADSPLPTLPVDFCIVKRSAIVLYSIQEQLMYRKEIPLHGGAFLARRIGQCLCIADRERYSLIHLDTVTATPILPISQMPSEPGTRPHRPMIAVVSEEEFLILSWTGAGTMGVFINVNGDPVRGTLEWPSHPLSICLEFPYATALLSDQTIQVHNVESQEVVQSVPAPPLPSANEASLSALLSGERRALAMCPNGFFVPSQKQPEKLRLKNINVLDRNAKPGITETSEKRFDNGNPRHFGVII